MGGGSSKPSPKPNIEWLEHLEKQREIYEREMEIEELKAKWQGDKTLYNELPERIQQEEKAYYLKAKDENYYDNEILKTRYNNIFQRFKDNKITQLNSVKEEVNQVLENNVSKKIAEKHVEELYKDTLKKNKALKVDIDNYYKKVSTDERKVYYQDEQIENAEYYQKFIMIMYYVLIVIYILFGPFIWQQAYKSIFMWILIILYIIFPFLLNYIIQFLVVNFTVDIKSKLNLNFFKKIF